MRKWRTALAVVALSSCLPIAATFCPSVMSPARPAAAAISEARKSCKWQCAMGEDTGSFSGSPRPSLLFVTGVLGPDINKLKRLLVDSGAFGVGIEEADYGSKLVASLNVEKLQSLAPTIAELVRPSGRIGISGIADSDVDKIDLAFSSYFEDMKRMDDGQGNARVTAWRKDPWMVMHSHVQSASRPGWAFLSLIPCDAEYLLQSGARLFFGSAGAGARGHQD